MVTYTHLHKGCLWSRDFHLPLPTGWCESTLRESQSFPVSSSATPTTLYHYTLTPPSRGTGCLDPYHLALIGASASLLRRCFNRLPGKTGLLPTSVEGKVHGAWYYLYNTLWIYNYLKKKKKLKKEEKHIYQILKLLLKVDFQQNTLYFPFKCEMKADT